jgi:hypothetical protein
LIVGNYPKVSYVKKVTAIAEALEEKLRNLPPQRACYLESLVRDALALVSVDSADIPTPTSTWPPGYFEQTAGSFSSERIERPPQGSLEVRTSW